MDSPNRGTTPTTQTTTTTTSASSPLPPFPSAPSSLVTTTTTTATPPRMDHSLYYSVAEDERSQAHRGDGDKGDTNNNNNNNNDEDDDGMMDLTVDLTTIPPPPSAPPLSTTNAPAAASASFAKAGSSAVTDEPVGEYLPSHEVLNQSYYRPEDVYTVERDSDDEEDDPFIQLGTSVSPFLTSDTQTTFRGIVTLRQYKDVLFAVLFVIVFIVMLLCGIILHSRLQPLVEPVEETLGYFVFTIFRDSAGFLFFTVCLAIAVSWAWLYGFKWLVSTSVWLTLISVPLFCVTIPLWGFPMAIRKDPDDAGLIMLSIIVFVCGILFSVFCWKMRDRIFATIALMKDACQVLFDEPTVILVPLFLSVVQVCFSLVWMYSFSWIFLLGHSNTDAYGSSYWILNPSSYLLMFFFIFVYLWTVSIIGNVATFTLSGISCHWYFHRKDPIRENVNPVLQSFTWAVTKSFGTVCLASLVGTLLQLLQVIYRMTHEDRSKCDRCIRRCVSYIRSWVEMFSRFVLIYASMTGDGFFMSLTVVSNLLIRNTLNRAVVDILAHVVIKGWVLMVSILFSMGTYAYVSYRMQHEPYSWSVSLVTFLITYFIMDFNGSMLLKIIDALFICYIVESDYATAGQPRPWQQDPNNEFTKSVRKTFSESLKLVPRPNDQDGANAAAATGAQSGSGDHPHSDDDV